MADRQHAQALAGIEGGPFTSMLAIRIESAAGGTARLTMPFDARLLNPGGPQAPIHGGAIASLIDTAACAAVWSMPETQRSATVSISVNYSRAAVVSDLIAEAEVREHGRRIASVRVEVRDRSGALIADGLVTYKIA